MEYGLTDVADLKTKKNVYLKSEKIIIFGLYNNYDLAFVKKYMHQVVIIWGGTDCINMINNHHIYDFILKHKFIKHIAISDNLYLKLNSLLKDSIIINTPFRLLNYNNYLDISTNLDKKNIYIYTSININRAKEIYNANIYLEVIKRFPNINFIIAYGQYTTEQIINIYKSCFLGIRLTNYDGNANTVQELGLLGINCIHNGKFVNSINWANIDDIINIINNELKFETQEELINKRTTIRQNMLNYLESSTYEWLIN
jgi:hypothetical protein